MRGGVMGRRLRWARVVAGVFGLAVVVVGAVLLTSGGSSGGDRAPVTASPGTGTAVAPAPASAPVVPPPAATPPGQDPQGVPAGGTQPVSPAKRQGPYTEEQQEQRQRDRLAKRGRKRPGDPAPLIKRPREAPNRIEDGYFVQLIFDATASDRARVERLVRDHGGRIVHRSRSKKDGPWFSTRLTPAALAAVRHERSVNHVSEQARGSYGATQSSAPWGLDRINQTHLPLDGAYT